jgi:putative SOS response-associated peptidase YedK
MCGSYLNKVSKAQYRDVFGVDADVPLEFAAGLVKYTDRAPIIVNSGAGLEIVLARWGFVPSSARSLQEIKHLSLYNATSERVMTSSTWRGAFQRSRCIIPVSSYFEGRVKDGSKREIGLRSGKPMGLAGLRSTWCDEDGVMLETFTMLTTEPSLDVVEVHHRMPVVLKPRDYGDWLEETSDHEALLYMLRPYPVRRLDVRTEVTPLSRTVN